MTEHNKLVIGKPYEIVVKEDGRIMQIKGSKLTKDDVDEFLNSGIITKEDVVELKVCNQYPSFDEFVAMINSKIGCGTGFFKKLYNTYPQIAFSLLLKEYSSFINDGFKPSVGDTLYIVNTVDHSIMDFVVLNGAAVDNLTYFASFGAAKTAVSAIDRGLSSYEKP